MEHRYDEVKNTNENWLKIPPLIKAMDMHQEYYDQGVSLDNLGRREVAIASYDQAIELKPYMHEAWFGRGSVLIKQGRWKVGTKCIERAMAIRPEHYNCSWFMQDMMTTMKKRLQSLFYKQCDHSYLYDSPMWRLAEPTPTLCVA